MESPIFEGMQSPRPSTETDRDFSVMVASPSWLLRKRIAGVFRTHPGITVLDDAEDCAQMVNRASDTHPDILFVDASICDHRPGGELLCSSRLPTDIRIIATCREFHLKVVAESLKEGARGMLLESSTAGEFWKAALTVMRGDIWLPRALLVSAFRLALREVAPPPATDTAPPPPGAAADNKLTQREQEIAALICQGKCDKDVARQLNISEKTIKTHLQNIYRKLGVHGRLQLALGQRSVAPGTRPN